MTASSHPSDIDFGIGGSDQIRTFWMDEFVAEVPRFNQALCAEVDFAIFFPEKGESNGPAKQICGLCPERVRCLEWAFESDQRFGIYGGLTPRERRKVTRKKVADTYATNAATKGRMGVAAHAAGPPPMVLAHRERPLTPRTTERLS